MGEDCGTWHPQLHFNWKSSQLNSSGGPLDLGLSAYMNPSTNTISTNGAFPAYALSEASNLRAGPANEPHGWFYCLPRFRQAFTPAPTSIIKEEKLRACDKESCRETLQPNGEPECAQKKFLVVDHSGDQTTLIFSSGVGASVRCLASWKRPNGAYNLCTEDAGTERVLKNLSEPVLTDEFNDHNENGGESEMREDSEELDALLYSDDEDDGDSAGDDEVTSTGHSPSTVISYDKQDWFEGSTDEVAGYVGTTKKRKLVDGGYDDKPFLMDTASSVKRYRSIELEDDAESSRANQKRSGLREIDFLSSSSNKKMRKEKIRETVSILQSIIPDGKGKGAILVLDEAIQYLKYLKLRAKAFGIDAL